MAFLASGDASDSVFDSGMDIPVWQQRQVPWRFSPVEVPQIQFSTSGWTFLFGNRDRYRGFSRLCVPLANRPSSSFTKQVTQHVLLRSWKESTAYKNDVYFSPNRSS